MNEDIKEGQEEKVRIKKKPGRPQFQYEDQLNGVKERFPEIKTRRGLQNKCYEINAKLAIKDEEGMEFLYDRQNQTHKPSILSELGRLKNEDDIRLVAKYICKRAKNEKLSTKVWERICRNIRHFGQLV